MAKTKKVDEDMLKPLRERYLVNLKKGLQPLKVLEKKRMLNNEDRQSLIHTTHKFIGSGKTFGFPRVTETGSALYATLTASPEAKDKDIVALLKKFLTACDKAGKE